MKFPRRKNSKTGFTLIEVTLAIGIIGFGFVSVLSLLPVGLDVSRRAIDATVVSQIVQQLTTEAQQTNFSKLDALAEATAEDPYYFDDQGNRATPQNAIYKAVIDTPINTNLPEGITSQRLKTLTFYILNMNAGRTDSIDNPVESQDSTKMAALIPDNGL